MARRDRRHRRLHGLPSPHGYGAYAHPDRVIPGLDGSSGPEQAEALLGKPHSGRPPMIRYKVDDERSVTIVFTHDNSGIARLAFTRE